MLPVLVTATVWSPVEFCPTLTVPYDSVGSTERACVSFRVTPDEVAGDPKSIVSDGVMVVFHVPGNA